jgi:quinol monooxygenase YgiN
VVVHLSRGRFDPVRCDTVRALLSAAETDLIPAIRRLPGLISYDAALDEASGSVITVSVWEAFEPAAALSAVPEMLALRDSFATQSVTFEPTIIYEGLWRIAEGWLA